MRDRQGRFLPGPDRQRHQFTREEARHGYRQALKRAVELMGPWDGLAWIYYRVRGHYRARRRPQ